MNRTVTYRLNGVSFEWDVEKAVRNRLFVVHVISHEEVIRIISARRATAEERRIYEQF